MRTPPEKSPLAHREEGDEYDSSGSYAQYAEYNKVLRTWFVAFGIGGPALFLVNEGVARQLAAVGYLKYVATLFLIGAGAQVFGAFINKVANWYVHQGFTSEGGSRALKHRFAAWVVDQFWVDVVLDLVTICVFGYAAWLMLAVLAAQKA